MGRGKLNMELIRDEKSRMISYHKRKKGLTKKAREFQILCGVDTCVIIFGPKVNNRPVDVEIWPTDRTEVRRIINRFRSECAERIKRQDLSDFFLSRKNKLHGEIAKLRKACVESKFSSWDNRLNFLSFEHLRILSGVLEAKFEVARHRLLELKSSGKILMDGSKFGTNKGSSINNKSSRMASTFSNALLQKNIELQMLNQQQYLSCAKPFYSQLPTYFPPDQQQMIPFNVNPINSSNLMMMMMMQCEEINQYGGMTSNKILYAPMNSSVYDPTTEMLGNMMFNDPRAHPVSYYPRLPCNQAPVMQNDSSQMRIPPLSELFDIDKFETGRKDGL